MITPVILMQPLITSSPVLTFRGRLSPVKALVLSDVSPLVTTPSIGIFSPGFTIISVPTATSSGSTFRVFRQPRHLHSRVLYPLRRKYCVCSCRQLCFGKAHLSDKEHNGNALFIIAECYGTDGSNRHKEILIKDLTLKNAFNGLLRMS